MQGCDRSPSVASWSVNVTTDFKVQQQVHSYRGGHSLAGSSVKLERADQDLVDRLSDLAGPIGPGQTFAPYLTFYPLRTEPYYVVARTWQDLAAPRAGCVITRSLFVPLNVWRNGGALSSLLTALETENRDLARSGELAITPTPGEEFQVLNPDATMELVEAFFLEKRQPIVVFDAASPEVFASRLIEGLWPAFRSSMAICTHAYSPRSIQGRPFDLLFAPATSRSNFSAWTGRRIDGQAANRQPRHNWTLGITQRLFGDARVKPLTISFGELDVSQDETDESQFRLAMLWEELRQRSKESPLAILGMLDIVSSLGQSDQSVARLLRPFLSSSIHLAEEMGTAGLLQYLITLLGKFPSRLPPTAALSGIRRAAMNAAVQGPLEALDFIRTRAKQGSTPPAVLMAGLADGFVQGEVVGNLLDAMLSLDDESLLSLIGYGRKFASKLIDAVEEQQGYEGLKRLERLVSTADIGLRNRARRNIIPFLRHDAERDLLAELLRGVDGGAFLTSLRWLGASGALQVPELVDAVVQAADSPSKVRLLRTMLTQLPPSPSVDEALTKSLTVSEDDIRWFMSAELESNRSGAILRGVLKKGSDAELRQIPASLADGILTTAHLESAELSAGDVSRILSLVPSSCNEMLRAALVRSHELINSTDPRFAQLLLGRVFSEPASHSLAVEAINRFAPGTPARELALMATSSALQTEQISDNLMLLDAAAGNVRWHFASRVDVLTEQIVSRRAAVPSMEAIEAWAKLIYEAGRHAGEAVSFRAASVALEFALRSTRVQVSPLLKASFPLVHAHLRSTKSTPSMLSFFSFQDWDRCKTARKDLARAFISSVWPPADLLRIADEVMEVESFSWILANAPGGRDFLAHAVADPSLPLHVRNAFLGRT